MRRFAKLDANQVVEAIWLFEDGDEPEGVIDGENAVIGATWDGANFIPSAAEVISIEDMRARMIASPAQIKVTLYDLGLTATVQALIDADPRAKIIWDEALEIRRTNPLVNGLGAGGFTPEQIDDIFVYAQALVI